MKHRIDPKIDCVFKALLGAEENRNLLVHFLNAVLALELKAPVVDVEILNPYNEREFVLDKLSIVDVKARDREGRLFQVEIQLVQYGHLPSRMIYSWADIYSQQLKSGDGYDLLKPTYSIWLLDDTLVTSDKDYVHSYKLRDNRGQTLFDHGGIWLFEIEKFSAQQIANEEQRWLRFLKEGERLDDQSLPAWMSTQEMEQAMSTLRKFSEKERDYHAYQGRQNFLREQRTIQKELETALTENQELLTEKEAATAEKQAAVAEKQAAMAEKEAAMAEKEAAMAEKQEALSEIARLKALLEQQGTSH